LAEAEKKENFWTTMPGILTGVAAILTALTGLFVAVYQRSNNATKEAPVTTAGAVTKPASSVPVAAVNSTPNTTASSAETPLPARVTKGYVSLTSRQGEVTQLSVASFRHNFTDKSIELTNGQTILFEKIRAIDFLDLNREMQESTVKVTLIDGRVVPGILKTGYAFKGESDIGPFNIWLYDVKQVVFPPAN
jgi:hypothetical protein